MKPTPSWRNAKGSASERGYTYAWTKARNAFLREYPLCVMCEVEGHVTAAAVVDHIIPHRGDETLFWERGNWQSLCKLHHDSDKQVFEKSGEKLTKFTSDGKVVW